MLLAYRKLPTSIKLAIAAMTLVIPLGILSFFMEMRFRHASQLNQTELAGTQALRFAFTIQHFLTNHSIQSELETIPDSSVNQLELHPANPGHEVELALAQLNKADQETRKSHYEALPYSDLYACIDLTRINNAWEWYNSTLRRVAYEDASDAISGLISRVANCAHLSHDPAHSSHMITRATVDVLPQSCTITEGLQSMALNIIRERPHQTVGPLDQSKRDFLLQSMEFFKKGVLKRILDESHVALTDGNSPSLNLHYGNMLGKYQQSAHLLIEVASRLEQGEASAPELFNAASRVHASGYHLFNEAMDEMDLLIRKRMQDDRQQRFLVLGVCLAGLTITLLLLFLSARSITLGIGAVATYVRSVAHGDYTATADSPDLGPELTGMIDDTNAMVTAFRDQISHLDGILQGMTVPCFVVDRDERITYANLPALKLADIHGSAESVLGQKLSLIAYGDATTQTHTGMSMAEDRPIRDTLLEFTTLGGRIRHVRFDVTPLKDPNGDVTGAFAMVTDLTDMVEKEKNIERLAAFPREAPTPVLSADRNGTILYLNTAASNLITHSGMGALPSFLPEGHTEIIASCLSSGRGRHGIESQINTKVFSWTYHPLPGQELVHMYAADITERIRAEEQLLHDTFHDTLTGLPNKALFLDRANQAFRRARRRNTPFAVLFLDLDGFKNINDGLGHDIGDKLLARFAWRIRKLLGPDETLARLGGDEFTILLPLVSDDDHAIQVANRIQGDLKVPFDIDGTELFVSASIGVINAPDGATDANDLLRDAETAMYRAKSLGRSRAEVFDASMHTDASDRLQLENDLKRAVEQGEFEPYYQPIISLTTGRIAGFEALIRWVHPTQGILAPARFISLAEETGLIVPMGAFMLETACRQVKRWQQLPSHRELTMSVNMSVTQLAQVSIDRDIEKIIRQTGISPSTLKIEITESGLMSNVSRSSALLKNLEKIGVSFMIDDFGTGYSSLSHLHQFPFHFLKIDQSFVSTMEDKPDNREIVHSVISLAHTLGKRVVAEGVETASQRDQLRAMGCEFVQGYYFARPLPAAKAEELLEDNPMW